MLSAYALLRIDPNSVRGWRWNNIDDQSWTRGPPPDLPRTRAYPLQKDRLFSTVPMPPVTCRHPLIDDLKVTKK
jgi:hypothetical protein